MFKTDNHVLVGVWQVDRTHCARGENVNKTKLIVSLSRYVTQFRSAGMEKKETTTQPRYEGRWVGYFFYIL